MFRYSLEFIFFTPTKVAETHERGHTFFRNERAQAQRESTRGKRACTNMKSSAYAEIKPWATG